MLNAKLTATGRHSVRLSLLRPAPFFLPLTFSPSVFVLSLYRNSLSALPRRTIPNKWRDKKRQAGSGRREGGERRGGWARRRWWWWKRITSGSPRCISMNLKLFFVRASAAGTSVAKTTKEGVHEERKRGSGTYVYIPPILKDVNRKNNFCLLPELKLFARLIRAQMLFFF